MKRIDWTCPINVFPTNNGEVPEGYTASDQGTNHSERKFDPFAKEFVFTDMDSGDIIHYKMTGDLGKDIAGQLKMNNKALDAKLKEEAARARAQDLLSGSNGATPPPEQVQKMLRQIREGE